MRTGEREDDKRFGEALRAGIQSDEKRLLSFRDGRANGVPFDVAMNQVLEFLKAWLVL